MRQAQRLSRAQDSQAASPLLKERALHQFVQKRADAAAFLLRFGDDLRDREPVAERDVAAGGVDRELLREVAQEERLLRREQLLVIRDAGELAAVDHVARGIDRLGEL